MVLSTVIGFEMEIKDMMMMMMKFGNELLLGVLSVR